MNDLKRLLDFRKKIKSKKPSFVTQDSHKRREIKIKWRRPKGLHSKMRQHKKGYPICVSIGWRSPTKVRGLHKFGLMVRRVNSVLELSNIDNNKEAIVISSRVGLKKRLLIIEEAQKNKIKVLNYKDVGKYVDSIKKKREELMRVKKKKLEEKKEAETKKKPKEKDKKTLAEKIQTEEEKKEQEKKEKDKVLTKKDAI